MEKNDPTSTDGSKAPLTTQQALDISRFCDMLRGNTLFDERCNLLRSALRVGSIFAARVVRNTVGHSVASRGVVRVFLVVDNELDKMITDKGEVIGMWYWPEHVRLL